MTKAMIISVGGTPEPIIKSIGKYRPDFISFYASQDTCDKVALLKSESVKNGIKAKSEITLVDNVNDLLHCHEKAEEAVNRVIKKGSSKENVVVDYTGGTKNMSVALALAAITHGFSFSYVGGKERTKDGVGIVVDGREEIYESVNPWDFLAVEEKKKIAVLFNQYQFKAAKELADSIRGKTTKYKSIFNKTGFLIDGYYKWDMFRHREAVECFKRAKIEDLKEYGDKTVKSFAKATEKCMDFLEKIATLSKKPDNLFVLDIFSNAERRFEEGKVDDAILRLYRLVEMMAQERLAKKHNINTSDVKQDEIPSGLKADFIANYKNHRNGKIEISQTAAFKLLKALGDELGVMFKSNEAEFIKIQSSRNYSYLAHGFDHSKEKTYLNLRDFVLNLNIIDPADAPVFPKIEL